MTTGGWQRQALHTFLIAAAKRCMSDTFAGAPSPNRCAPGSLQHAAVDVTAQWRRLSHLLHCLVGHLSGEHHDVKRQLVGACICLDNLQGSRSNVDDASSTAPLISCNIVFVL
jgi:hypothetical protein